MEVTGIDSYEVGSHSLLLVLIVHLSPLCAILLKGRAS